MKLDTNLSKDSFNNLPPNVQKTLTNADKKDLISTLSLIAGASLLGLYISILDAPVSKPVSQIKAEPIEPVEPKQVRKPDDREPGIKHGDREPNFDQVSSFVGKVTYNPDFNTMEIKLNDRTYGYCNVPRRTFDAFSGAGSKGVFYNQTIKGQFDC